MKATLALLGLFVLLVAGCGGGNPSPDGVASKWAGALAEHDYAKACSLEAPSYAGKDCVAGYQEQFKTVNAMRGVDVLKGLEAQGCAVIKRYAYCFITGPNLGDTPAVLVLQQAKNGSWHVVGVD